MFEKICQKYVIGVLICFICLSNFWIIWLAQADFSDFPTGDTEYLNALPWTDNETLEENFLPAVMQLILQLVGVTALILMLAAGIMMVTSFGNSGQRDKAKKMLYWGILGIAFIVLAYALVKGITQLQFNR